jgi:polyisoprenoid-binding protein YceI
VEARIAVASLTTGDRERDAAVLSPDFLDAGRYPDIAFVSRSIRPAAPDRGRIIGDLTIRDVTQRVTLDARRLERTASSARIAATTTLSRAAWGLKWAPALEAGGLLVGDEIKVSLLVEIVAE